MPMTASAVAYSSFFAIPSVLLLSIGLFTLVASPQTIAELMDRFSTFMPTEATQLLGESLQNLEAQPASGLAHDRGRPPPRGLGVDQRDDDVHGCSRHRLRPHATGGASCASASSRCCWWARSEPRFSSSGCSSSSARTSNATSEGCSAPRAPSAGSGGRCSGRCCSSACSWRSPSSTTTGRTSSIGAGSSITPGSLVAVVAWLVASTGFAVYTSFFGSANKAWGSFSAVIVTLTWLWLTAMALLFGGELNAEVERSREFRRGRPEEATASTGQSDRSRSAPG